MVRPLVTIITPTYNQQGYVAESIESVLAQSYPHWEQVVVDDGSTDATRDVVASYRDPRIRLLCLPHRGLASLAESYNAALAASRGDLVAILEGDDRWPPDKLERQVPMFDSAATVLSWGRAALIDQEGQSAGTFSAFRTGRGATRLSAAAAFHRLTRSNIFAPTVTVMVRRRVLDAIGGFRQTGSTLFVDLPTWLFALAISRGEVIQSAEVLGLYRVHAGQTTQRQRTRMTRDHLSVVLSVVDELNADTLAVLGWDASSRRRAVSRGRLAEGETLLMSGEFAGASVTFRRALFGDADLPDRVLAAIGLLSAAARVDLVRVAFSLRARLRG